MRLKARVSMEGKGGVSLHSEVGVHWVKGRVGCESRASKEWRSGMVG